MTVMEYEETVTQAVGGDETAFAELVEAHRRELLVHCYRMLGSFTDAEDQVQETFLRAWRRRSTFAGRASYRAWLYGIATHACLDQLAAHPRTVAPTAGGGASEVTWLEPIPDELLDLPAVGAEPDDAVVQKETIELAYLVAIQHLPPKQRAVLVVRDVLGWPAADAAALLELSVASANSALQRARATLRERLPRDREEWSGEPSADDRAVLTRWMRASEAVDFEEFAALLREDARHTMPPDPYVYVGRAEMLREWDTVLRGPDALGEWRLLPTWVNHQPAAGVYLRSPGHDTFVPFCLDVLTVVGCQVAELTSFGTTDFARYGLPPELTSSASPA